MADPLRDWPVRYYVVATQSGSTAAAWGRTEELALHHAKLQNHTARIITPALRWLWAARLLARVIRGRPEWIRAVERAGK